VEDIPNHPQHIDFIYSGRAFGRRAALARPSTTTWLVFHRRADSHGHTRRSASTGDHGDNATPKAHLSLTRPGQNSHNSPSIKQRLKDEIMAKKRIPHHEGNWTPQQRIGRVVGNKPCPGPEVVRSIWSISRSTICRTRKTGANITRTRRSKRIRGKIGSSICSRDKLVSKHLS